MRTRTDGAGKHRSLCVALGLVLLAWVGLGKFPGPSGLIGGAGWLLLAATVLAAPSLIAGESRLPKRNRVLTLLCVGASLALVVSSVIIWAVAR